MTSITPTIDHSDWRAIADDIRDIANDVKAIMRRPPFNNGLHAPYNTLDWVECFLINTANQMTKLGEPTLGPRAVIDDLENYSKSLTQFAHAESKEEVESALRDLGRKIDRVRDRVADILLLRASPQPRDCGSINVRVPRYSLEQGVRDERDG
jgi:hypothetical protein